MVNNSRGSPDKCRLDESIFDKYISQIEMMLYFDYWLIEFIKLN